ncbi:MAG: diacylglycerol kinase family protein [Bacteroidia bacterium]|jgi:diacylglycerol kinase|nr:diacylglycerol kinase family protein [Bacteroidia bacterium]
MLKTSSFKVALAGIKIAFSTQLHIRVHFLAALVVLLAGIVFQIQKFEWLIVLVLIGMVISAELFNTSIEWLCNKIQPGYDNEIKMIKDVAAAAVLLCSLVSFIVACIIFVPYII